MDRAIVRVKDMVNVRGKFCSTLEEKKTKILFSMRYYANRHVTKKNNAEGSNQ
jgi:hypothetical protein